GTGTTATVTLPLHDALPICCQCRRIVDAVAHHGDATMRSQRANLGELGVGQQLRFGFQAEVAGDRSSRASVVTGQHDSPDAELRSEEHTSELQSRENLVCRL